MARRKEGTPWNSIYAAEDLRVSAVQLTVNTREAFLAAICTSSLGVTPSTPRPGAFDTKASQYFESIELLRRICLALLALVPMSSANWGRPPGQALMISLKSSIMRETVKRLPPTVKGRGKKIRVATGVMALITPAARLREARMRSGFKTMSDAAKSYSWPYETYKKHETGGGIPQDTAVIYATAYGVSAQWILLGVDPPDWDTAIKPEGKPSFRFLPLLTLKEAGQMGTRLKPSGGRVTAIDAATDVSDKAFVVEIDDDSMDSTPATGSESFRRGDLVAIDPERPINPGDFVLARVEASKTVIFRRFRDRAALSGAGAFELVPLNVNYSPVVAQNRTAITILGRLVRHIRMY